MPEKPLSIRLLDQRAKLDKRCDKTGFGQSDLLRLAVHELLAKYKTPEETIAAVIRFRTASAK